MSYTTKDAVKMAMNGDAAKFQEAISDLLMDKVRDAVSLKKIEVASNFMTSDIEEEVEIEEETLEEGFADKHEKHYDNHEEASYEFERKAEDAARRGDKVGATNYRALARYHEKARDLHGKVLDHHENGRHEQARNLSQAAHNRSKEVEAKHKEMKDRDMID